MDLEVLEESLEIGRVMLAICIEKEVEIEGIRLEVRNARPHGLAFAPAAAHGQPQHFGARGCGHGAGAVPGAVVHDQHAVQAEGLEPGQHWQDVVRLVMGGKDRGYFHRRVPRFRVAAGWGWP